VQDKYLSEEHVEVFKQQLAKIIQDVKDSPELRASIPIIIVDNYKDDSSSEGGLKRSSGSSSTLPIEIKYINQVCL